MIFASLSHHPDSFYDFVCGIKKSTSISKIARSLVTNVTPSVFSSITGIPLGQCSSLIACARTTVTLAAW